MVTISGMRHTHSNDPMDMFHAKGCSVALLAMYTAPIRWGASHSETQIEISASKICGHIRLADNMGFRRAEYGRRIAIRRGSRTGWCQFFRRADGGRVVALVLNAAVTKQSNQPSRKKQKFRAQMYNIFRRESLRWPSSIRVATQNSAAGTRSDIKDRFASAM
jgi:hypothetical protein